MKIAILADTHLGARGDIQIFHDYFSRFFKEVFFPYIDKHNIKTIIHLGDLVDRRKFINFSTANVLRTSFIEPILFRKIETHIIVGNHDCFHKNNNEINALREIVMGRLGFTIYSNPAEVSFDGVMTLLLPWISPENEEKSAEMIVSTDAQICFAHLELAGFEGQRGQLMEHGMNPDAFTRFSAVYTGHYHHKSSKQNIHYVGSPYEMTWADCDDQKGFHVFDTDTLKVEFIPNPITLYQKVHFDGSKSIDTKGKIVKLIVADGADRKKLDKAVAAMEKTALDIQVIDEHLSVDDTGGQAIMIGDVEDTMKIVDDYIRASDIDADKDALIGLMKQLYVEAQNL